MKSLQESGRVMKIVAWATLCAMAASLRAADHNDPNVINSIFSGIEVSAADLYDIFGFPAENTAGGEERVVIALTFAAAPRTGELDKNMLYRVRLYAGPRAVHPDDEDQRLDTMLAYVRDAKKKYLHAHAAEVRVRPQADGRALVRFIGFPGGDFDKVLALNQSATLEANGGKKLQVYVGGRDDAFFNDLPGFFRSINYAPQFYRVPRDAPKALRELPIPKTLIELEDNPLFNYDPAHPNLGSTEKAVLPSGPYEWQGRRFKKDVNGNYRFAYSGQDAQAGKNVNAIILEMPLSFITGKPAEERVVNTWGESWVTRASKIAESAETAACCFSGAWNWVKSWFVTPPPVDKELESYRLIDTDGVPFADAGLNERADSAQLGADNEILGLGFVRRLGHLGWGFGPSITALGLGTCFDHGGSPVSVNRTYDTATEAFPRAKKCVFQEVNMPDDSWRRNKNVKIPLKRPFEIFVPNVCAIDMDTTGSWPYGRRLEDQVANRFLSIFLDMKHGCGGKACNVETLSDQHLWESAPVVPKTSPNPMHNDVPFLSSFPYLAPPHSAAAYAQQR